MIRGIETDIPNLGKYGILLPFIRGPICLRLRTLLGLETLNILRADKQCVSNP